MKLFSRKTWMGGSALVFLLVGIAGAQTSVRSSGVIFRGKFWDVDTDRPIVSVSDTDGSVHVGPAGGWMTFFSRVDNNRSLELSLGAIAKVDIGSEDSDGDVSVMSVIPLLLGFRYDLLNVLHGGSMHPYVTLGGGPYWHADVQVEDHRYEEEVGIRSKTWLGAYVGGGMNFHLASWLALNVDAKYHLVQLKPEHEFSGLEFGVGIGFLWGKYDASGR